MAAKPKTKDTREKKNRKLTRKDVQKAATRCKNWGRWGKDDEIGTLNFTTPEDIVAAAQLVKKGKVYEFLFIAPALPITGAVGSPVNPLAIK